MNHATVEATGPYALVAEFETPEQLIAAAERARAAGYKKMDAYTPFPVHGLSDAIGFDDKKIPWTVFAGGLAGAFTGYTLQWYTSVIDYPMNVGGKPLNSLPSFVPITFEVTILLASFGAFFGMLIYNRLPKPYHSIFNTPGFERASQDRFFLALESSDALFESRTTRDFLRDLNPLAVSEVGK
jgi:hypothetical protein